MPQQMMQPMAPQRSSLSICTGSDMFAIFEASPTSATPPFLSPNSTTTTTSQDDGWDVNAAHVFDTNPQASSGSRNRSQSDSGAIISPSKFKPKPTRSDLAPVPESNQFATPQKSSKARDFTSDG